MEKCWQIVEVFPILVSIKKSWTGKYYCIEIPPMKIQHVTAFNLGMNLTLPDHVWEYRKEMGLNSLEREQQLRKYQNDVSFNQYDYSDGNARYSASTLNDVKNWLELHKEYVYFDGNL